jgi:ATP-dependent DNA ligase
MPKKTFPTFIPPMMANSAKEPFDSPDWIFEVKLDGYRGITVFDPSGRPHLWSRNGLPLEQKFPAVAKALSKLKLRSTILDGEVVAVDENGIPRFQLLQRFQKQPAAPTLYYVFDVLWSDGEDITAKPIMDRRRVLERIIKPTADIQDALKRMKPLFTEKSPFENPQRVAEKVQWVKPKLVCEVTFAEWTDGEQMRQTVFLGWRDDKDPRDVVKETPSRITG